MYQHHEAHQALRTVTESNHPRYPKAAAGPSPSARRDEPAIRLRIVAAPGGVAFVRDEPARGRG